MAAAKLFPPDAIERNIPGIEDAEQYLQLHRPHLLASVSDRWNALRNEFEQGSGKLFDMGFRMGVICLARVLARHGSMAGSHYDYHDELHALDLLEHLRELHTTRAGRQLGVAQWMYLAMFAGAHDLRQKESGYGEDGVGNNERASADEAMRILNEVGFDQEFQQPIFQLLRWMIHGTTFFAAETQFEGFQAGPGALAPHIAQRISGSGNSVGELTADQAAQLVLLAADTDTANVAQSIDQYAEQSARLCREYHKIQGHPFLDHDSVESVLQFLTQGQEQYFFVMQQFNSDLAKRAFGPAKAKTGKLLRRLTAWLRRSYPPERLADDDLLNGETILQDFLIKARDLAGVGTVRRFRHEID